MESKIWHKWTYLWHRNRLTDIENRLAVTKGEVGGGGMDWEGTPTRDPALPSAAGTPRPWAQALIPGRAGLWLVRLQSWAWAPEWWEETPGVRGPGEFTCPVLATEQCGSGYPTLPPVLLGDRSRRPRGFADLQPLLLRPRDVSRDEASSRCRPRRTPGSSFYSIFRWQVVPLKHLQ